MSSWDLIQSFQIRQERRSVCGAKIFTGKYNLLLPSSPPRAVYNGFGFGRRLFLSFTSINYIGLGLGK